MFTPFVKFDGVQQCNSVSSPGDAIEKGNGWIQMTEISAMVKAVFIATSWYGVVHWNTLSDFAHTQMKESLLLVPVVIEH